MVSVVTPIGFSLFWETVVFALGAVILIHEFNLLY
jgi:hypothetical protein